MASSDRIDELKRKFDENPRRYFAPLANEFRKGGDLDQAILICQEFLPQQPGHMSGHIVYGQALYESDRLDEARGVFETALSLDPENLIALRHLGDIAGRQGDPTSARRWYERVLEADPRNDEIQSLLAGLGETPAGESVSAAPAFAAPPQFEEHAPIAIESHEPPQRSAPVPVEEPELLDLDVSIPDAPHAAPSSSQPARDIAPASSDFEPSAFGEIESTPETADLMPATEDRAEGFEATEFSAPAAPVAQTEGLESAFEMETSVDGAYVAPVPGLDRPEVTVDPQPGIATSGAFPELDEPMSEDRGEMLPPHGDPIAASATAPETTSHDDSLLDFDMPVSGTPAPTASNEAPAVSDAAASSIPAELPPEVIAAEAALIDAGVTAPPETDTAPETEQGDTDSIGSDLSFIDVGETTESEATADAVAAPENSAPSDATHDEPEHFEPPAQRPFVTETMAELYLKQGFRQEALSVYEQLSSAAPGDERLSSRVASLRAELAAPLKSSAPPVRDFFARIAARRPGERAVASAPPSDDDFGPSATEPPEPAAAPAGAAADSAVHAAPSAPTTASSQPRGGSIDALFGHRPIGTTEDSAASALAQAFGSGTEPTTPLAGNPTRPASGELTLDSVFREGSRGPRTSQGFSFDQFFSQNVDGDKTTGGRTSQELPAAGEPAERSEDDIEQFNSWLQGLKQR